jgi:unspecific monooxygenase
MAESRQPDGLQTLSFSQKLQWILRPLEFLEACSQQYGDIFTLPINPGNPPTVVISNPAGIQEIFTANFKQLDSGKEAGLRPLLVGEKSLLALSGEQHRQQRKLLMPSFHGERMQAYGQLIADLTKKVIQNWKIGEPFLVRSSMQAISFEVILKAVFGLENNPRAQRLTQLLIQRLEGSKSIFRAILLLSPVLQKDWGPWSPWGRLVRNEQQIDELIYAEIDERRKNLDSSRTDILSLMMAARDEAGEPMTNQELRDELMTLLIAGHETTATSLAWAFYWIHRFPEVLEKLKLELDSIGDNVDASKIFQLPYLDAVCKETLRIYPVTLFTLPRVVKSPIEIKEYSFESGTILNGCIYLTHHREDLYPDSKQFKPERFLERQYSTYEYLPFGGGSRRCIGMAFALFEMKLVLTTILSN